MAMVTGLPPNTSAEHWRADFIPEARESWPPVVSCCATCRMTLAELCHLTTGADVKSNHQSSGAKGNASSHQATTVQRDSELGHVFDEVPMHGQLPVVG